MHVLTLLTPEEIPRARTLTGSLARVEPDWIHELVLIAPPAIVARLAEEHGLERASSLCDELDLDIEALLALHSVQELTALVLPALLRRRASESAAPVLHLPPSVWVLGGLKQIADRLRGGGVLLVPRASEELPDDGLEPSAEQLERAGRVDETIIGVAPGEAASEFLDWWEAHLERTYGSVDARRAGERPEDRHWLGRYLELAPARFETGVLEDPGCNLSMWNLHAHTLTGPVDEPRVDGERPVRFLNLPGFDPERPHQLAPGASRARVSRSPVLHDLCERYAAELRANGWTDVDHHAEVGRRLDGQLVYDESLRAIYRTALTLGEPFEDLFGEGAARFIAWLQDPAPRGAAHGISRYVFHRVARERPDVVRSYPDLDGDDGARYAEWCWSFGRRELAIPDRFMPPLPPGMARPQPDAVPAQRRAPAPKAGRSVRERAALPPAGVAVRVTGYLGHTLGLGAAARGYARALEAAGVPVSTAAVPLHHLELPVELEQDYGRHGFEELVHEGRHGAELVAVNADELPDLVERLGEDWFEGPRIGVWGWETNTIPARWQRAFALIDEIWVYSSFMAENIGAVAPVPVIALPPPVEARGEARPQRLGVPDGFLFLFVFDYLSTVQRKNPVGLIEAFRRAFPRAGAAQLLIKTINAPLRPLAEEELLWAAHGREDIHVIDRSLTAEELDGLMAGCDCYVSLHRAEGFGLTLAEAMAAGKPVIATGYSGNIDFMNAANSFLVDYDIGRVGPDCEIYPPEGEWAEPRVDHAAELMRHVVEQPDDARARASTARADVARLLSARATGAAMRERLERVLSSPSAGTEQPALR